MDKITIEDIRSVRPDKELVRQLPDYAACHSARSLVNHVNKSYPVDGYRYASSVREGNIIIVKLVPQEDRR